MMSNASEPTKPFYVKDVSGRFTEGEIRVIIIV